MLDVQIVNAIAPRALRYNELSVGSVFMLQGSKLQQSAFYWKVDFYYAIRLLDGTLIHADHFPASYATLPKGAIIITL